MKSEESVPQLHDDFVKPEPELDAAIPQRATNTWDDLYSFENAVFEVEGTRFKVPKKPLFDASASPENIAKFKPADNENPEGVYVVEGVSKNAFKALLQVLYPLPFSAGSPVAAPSPEEWFAVLLVSTRWNMEAIRNKAATQIMNSSDIPSIQKLTIGRDYRINGLQHKAYLELIEREQGPTGGEINILTQDSAIRIYWAREQKLLCSRPQPQAQHGLGVFGSPAFVDTRDRPRAARSPRTGFGGFDYAEKTTSASQAVLQQFVDELKPGEVSGMSLIDVVLKARQAGVQRWLQEAYEAIVKRDEALTPAEAEKLDTQTAIRLCVAREHVLRDNILHGRVRPGQAAVKDTAQCLREAWALPVSSELKKRKAPEQLQGPARGISRPAPIARAGPSASGQ